MEPLRLNFTVTPDDFVHAGEASSALKRTLKSLGFSPGIVRRAAIAMYEGEINMVIHAHGGEISVDIEPERITMRLCDRGPGIPDIGLAMTEGYSTASDEVRDMGFGAGMGLPNMKRFTDYMTVDTVLGVGTTVTMRIDIAPQAAR